MTTTNHNPSPSMPSEQELESRHQVLNYLLEAKGELTRSQSDYAVLLSDQLVHAAQTGMQTTSRQYYNSLDNPLHTYRQNLPVIFKPGSLYNTQLSRQAEIMHLRESRGDEFKAVKALVPVMCKAHEAVVKPALQLAAGLAFVLAKHESVYLESVESLTGLPLGVGKHVFGLAQFETSSLDFRGKQLAGLEL